MFVLKSSEGRTFLKRFQFQSKPNSLSLTSLFPFAAISFSDFYYLLQNVDVRKTAAKKIIYFLFAIEQVTTDPILFLRFYCFLHEMCCSLEIGWWNKGKTVARIEDWNMQSSTFHFHTLSLHYAIPHINGSRFFRLCCCACNSTAKNVQCNYSIEVNIDVNMHTKLDNRNAISIRSKQQTPEGKKNWSNFFVAVAVLYSTLQCNNILNGFMAHFVYCYSVFLQKGFSIITISEPKTCLLCSLFEK